MIKNVKISWDGKNFVVRIPRRIASLLGVERGNILIFDVSEKRKIQKFKIMKVVLQEK